LNNHQKDIDRLYQAISELRKLMLERFEHVDHSIADQRKYIDNALVEQRKYIDTSVSELNLRIDDLRREVALNMRWMIGMWLTTMGMIAGLGGRILGMY